MSSEDVEPKPLQRTDSGNIIVYNPETQELKKIKIDDPTGEVISTTKRHAGMLTGSSAGKLTYRCRAPNVGSRTRIYADEKDNSSLLLASIKLSNLGWQTTLQRLCGKCNDVYTTNSVAARAA